MKDYVHLDFDLCWKEVKAEDFQFFSFDLQVALL